MLNKYTYEVISIRRELHKIPETSYEETKTQAFILDYLQKLSLSPEKCNKTGVICYFDMNKADTIALRADIDALNITEENDCEYKSQHTGKMHACGHDAHTAMLLTLAKVIKEEKLTFNSNVLLIFQPAEENIGGAKPIIELGILNKYNVKKIFGLHMGPDYPKGKIATLPQEFFASGAEYYIDIKGLSAHAAQPENGRDASYAAAYLVCRLKNAIPAGSDKFKTGVISVGTISSGSAVNIISANAKISGITRAFEDDIFENNLLLIKKACEDTEAETGCEVELTIKRTYPSIYNDPELFNKIKEIAGEKFILASRTFFAEDFAFYLREIPGVFMFLGIKDELHDKPLHNSKFSFDENVMTEGVKFYIDILNNM